MNLTTDSEAPPATERHAQWLLGAVRVIAAGIFALTLVKSVHGSQTRFVAPILAAAFAVALIGVSHSLERGVSWLARLSTAQWLWLFGLVAFALRLGWALFAHPEPLSDFATYRDLGLDLCRHGQYGYPTPSAYRPLGAPALVALISCGGLPFPLTFWLANAAFSAVTTAGVFLLARRLGGADVGKIASLLWVFWPSQIASCALIATEPLCTMLLVWTVVLALDVTERPRWSRIILVGLLLGATTYTRSNAILLAPLWFGYAVFRRRWRLAGYAAVVTIVMLATLLPWGLRNQAVMGEFNLTTLNGGVWLTYGNFDQASGGYMQLPFTIPGQTEVEQNRAGYRLAKEWILTHPGHFLRLIPFKLKATFDVDMAEVSWSTREARMASLSEPLMIFAQSWYLALTALFLVGAWRARAASMARDARALHALEWHLIVLGTWIVVHTFFPGDARYHAPLLPWYCGFAAIALAGRDRAAQSNGATR